MLERQLADFLPDGKYGADPSPELQEQMKHCKLTNLLGKYVFGDVEKLLKGKSERQQTRFTEVSVKISEGSFRD